MKIEQKQALFETINKLKINRLSCNGGQGTIVKSTENLKFHEWKSVSENELSQSTTDNITNRDEY